MITGRKTLELLGLLLLLLCLAACQPGPDASNGPGLRGQDGWVYADLRWLDRADAAMPGQDLIAAYSRFRGDELQIRLDLLDLAGLPDYDLYLAFDTLPGGTAALPLEGTAGIESDTLLVVPASGSIQALAPDQLAGVQGSRPGLGVRVLRDPLLDTLEISLDRLALGIPPLNLTMECFLTPAGAANLADQLGPFQTAGASPTPAAVLFAFWDSLPGYSPATALRRWDGAHTGPQGGRHGLYNLLRTARNARIPISLLDLKYPASLAALDFTGGLALAQDMAADQLLILPETLPNAPFSLPDWALQRSALSSRQVGLEFGLPASQFVFSPAGLPPAEVPGEAIFIPAAANAPGLEPVRISSWRGRRVIPLPGYGEAGNGSQQATIEGPALEVRRKLVDLALSSGSGGEPDHYPLMVLGGSLPASDWGNPQIARESFRYFSTHPWIRVLAGHDLLSARPPAAVDPAWSADPLPQPPEQAAALLEELGAALAGAPQNPVAGAAWQAFLSLFSPVFPASPELAELRINTLGQVGSLLAASHWAECDGAKEDGAVFGGAERGSESCPQTVLADCSTDPDRDGQPECILSSPDFFTLFEIQSGTLAFAFARTPNGVHQIVGPSFQFAAGLSDPRSWDLNRGALADPAAIPGAFTGPQDSYQVEAGPDQLVFTSAQGSRKTFRLTSHGLFLDYQVGSSGPVNVQLPLALDPWQRFSPGWAYRYLAEPSASAWSWSVDPQSAEPFRVEVLSSAGLQARAFNASLEFIDVPEDPNRDYPAGHFLPFPLAVVDLSSEESFTVQIDVRR